VKMAVITEDGIEEDGSYGFTHLAPIEYQLAEERRIKEIEDFDHEIQKASEELDKELMKRKEVK